MQDNKERKAEEALKENELDNVAGGAIWMGTSKDAMVVTGVSMENDPRKDAVVAGVVMEGDPVGLNPHRR